MNKDVEIWKDIPGYEGLYQVSNLGRVKSLPKEWVNGIGKIISHNGKILKGGLNGGYKHVTFSIDGNRKTYKVHQLMAMAFLNHKPCGMKLVIDHIDNDRSNNKLENLQLITQRQNTSKDRIGKSKYTGVSWCKSRNKWMAKIQLNGKPKYLGRFKCKIEASQYYQNAVKSIESNNKIKFKRAVFTSKYKGVNWDKGANKWRSQIYLNGKPKYLGLFKCELSAYYACQKSLNEYNKHQSSIR